MIKKYAYIVITIGMLVTFVILKIKGPKQTMTEKIISPLLIESSAFTANAEIPARYTCEGEDVNPPLAIGNIPTETKSLALIVDDPDAPSGTWTHWLVWNIDPTVNRIGEHSVPQSSIEGTTSFGRTGYGGPCPPSGTHHYEFKIYALDTTLDLPPETTKKSLEEAMKSHVIGEGKLIGVYSKK